MPRIRENAPDSPPARQDLIEAGWGSAEYREDSAERAVEHFNQVASTVEALHEFGGEPAVVEFVGENINEGRRESAENEEAGMEQIGYAIKTGLLDVSGPGNQPEAVRTILENGESEEISLAAGELEEAKNPDGSPMLNTQEIMREFSEYSEREQRGQTVAQEQDVTAREAASSQGEWGRLEFTQEHHESMVDFQMTPVRELIAEMSEVDKKNISQEDIDRISAAFDMMDQTLGNVSYEKALEYSDLTGELVQQVMECDIRQESLDMHSRAILFSEKMSGRQSHEWGEGAAEGALGEVLTEYSNKEYFHVASLEAAYHEAPNVLARDGENPQEAIGRAQEALVRDEQAYMAEGKKYQSKIYEIAKSAMGYKSGEAVSPDSILHKFAHGDYSGQMAEVIHNPAAGDLVNGTAPHFHANSKIGMRTFLLNVEKVGIENMGKLADNFGISNFGTYSSEDLERQLDILNNPENHKDVSIIISGSTGDHNGAKRSLSPGEGANSTIFLEAETAKDIQKITSRLAELQSQGAAFTRMSIVGHGSPTGDGMQFSDSFKLDRGVDANGRDSFEKSGMADLTNLIESGDDGLKQVTLISCHQGETFAPGTAIVNNPETGHAEAVRLAGGSLLEVWSKRYPDLALTAGQGPVYIMSGEHTGKDVGTGEKVMFGVQSSLARRLDRFRKIPSIDKLAQKLNARAVRKFNQRNADARDGMAHQKGWQPRTFVGGKVHSVQKSGKVKIGS